MRKPFDVLAEGLISEKSGGGGIRTRERLATLSVFKTDAFGRSATPPRLRVIIYISPQRQQGQPLLALRAGERNYDLAPTTP
jgi:hypothetical protein